MTIPISSVVGVNIAITPGVVNLGDVSTAMVVTAEAGPLSVAQRSRKYQSLASVGSDWSTSSEVYQAALAYYSQNPNASNFMAGIRFPAGAAAALVGGEEYGAIGDFTPISDGGFKINIDGDGQEIQPIDLTGASDLNDVASIIQTAIRAVGTGGYAAATCIFVEDVGFTIKSGTVSGSSSISAFLDVPDSGTDLTTLLAMSEDSVLSSSDGVDPETIGASLNALEAFDGSFFGVGFTKEMRDGLTVNGENGPLQAAQFCEATERVFVTPTNSANAKNSGAADPTAYLDGFNFTMPIYSSNPSQYPDFAAMSRAFVVNFNQPDSTLTLKFKQLAGISVEPVTEGEKLTLDSRRISTYINVGGNPMFAESYMKGSIFFDDAHNIAWLKNELEITLFAYLYQQSTKVPLTDKGGAAMEQQVINVLSKALNNGMTGPGETLDGEFLGNGYKTSVQAVADINPADKANRVGPAINFTIILSGAIHSIQIDGTAE